MNALPPFIKVIYDFTYGDKVGHFVLFGILNSLLTLTLLRKFSSKNLIQITLFVGIILMILISIEEFSQKQFPNRTFDLVDSLFSYLGVLIGGWVALQKM